MFQVLIAPIKSKAMGLGKKVKLWMNPDSKKKSAAAKSKAFCTSLFDVKPQDKSDYYTVGLWLVSKKMVFSIAVILGILSACLLLNLHPKLMNIGQTAGAIATYDYDSFALRFQEGTVNILAEDKYLAYEGQVKDGACTGNGKLYREDGSLLYSGVFANSVFEGNGNWYDPNGVMRYKGSFSANEYNGAGVSYWENGSKHYDGAWQNGLKSGEGQLFNPSGTKIFEGEFSADQLVYSQLARKTTEEVALLYTGNTAMYVDAEQFCVEMTELDAMYVADNDGDSLDESRTIATVYVLQNQFAMGGHTATSISELSELLGPTIYEGVTYATMADQVAITQLEGGGTLQPPKLVIESEFDDANRVIESQRDYEIYVYAFMHEELVYRFFCSELGENFDFYCIE